MVNRRRILELIACAGLPSLVPQAVLAATKPNVGLIFVGASWCQYCAAISPLLHDLQQQTGMDILVASLDRRPIAPFAAFEDATAHPAASGITSIPHIFVYNQTLDAVTHQVVGVRTSRSFVQRLSSAMAQSRAMG